MNLKDLALLMFCFVTVALFCGSLGIFASALMRRSTFSNVVTYGTLLAAVAGQLAAIRLVGAWKGFSDALTMGDVLCYLGGQFLVSLFLALLLQALSLRYKNQFIPLAAGLILGFLESYPVGGRTLVPFCTHEGSRLGKSEQDLRRLCPQARLLKGFEVRGSRVDGAEPAVKAWLTELGLI